MLYLWYMGEFDGGGGEGKEGSVEQYKHTWMDDLENENYWKNTRRTQVFPSHFSLRELCEFSQSK